MNDTNVIAFDLISGGHHGTFLRHLVRYWNLHATRVRLTLIVSSDFDQFHSVIREEAGPHVDIICVRPDEDVLPHGGFPRRKRTSTLHQWQTACNYTNQLRGNHLILMFGDPFLETPLAEGMVAPCPITALLFHARFMYRKRKDGRIPESEETRTLQHQQRLKSAGRHPMLQRVLTVDPDAVEPVKRLMPKVEVAHLPDPLERRPVDAEAAKRFRQRLHIPQERRVFLFFGSLAKRKGWGKLCQGLELLPDDLASQVALLVAGKPHPDIRRQLLSALSRVEQNTCVKVVFKEGFVPHEEIPFLFEAADYILAPYLQHTSTSSLLLHAALYFKPALSQSFGYMGRATREVGLGVAVDTADPAAIADGIRCLLVTPTDNLINRARMQLLTEGNTPELYGIAIVGDLI